MVFGQEIKVNGIASVGCAPFVQIHFSLDFLDNSLAGKGWCCEGNSVLLVNLAGCKISMQSVYQTS